MGREESVMFKNTNKMARLAVLALSALIMIVGCVIRTTPQPTRTTVVAPAPASVAEPAPVAVSQPPAVTTPQPVVTGPTLATTGGVANGAIQYPRQRVRYPIAIAYPRTINIYVDGHGLDPTVAVYDGYGNRIGFNDDGGSGLDSNIVLTVAPGNYIVEISGYGSSTGSFTLSVN
jgi:hypothetical protein